MSTQVRYFRSQNYNVDGEEIPGELALKKGNYIRAQFDSERPERAELFREGQLHSVIYYDRNPKDGDLVRQHRQQYGAVQMTIYDHPSLTPEGELSFLDDAWSWQRQTPLT